MVDIILVIIIISILALAARPLIKFKKSGNPGCYGCSKSCDKKKNCDK